MKLTLDNIRAYTIGCDRVEDAGSARFRRFAPDMEQPNDATEILRIRRDCPAAVRVRLTSDSTTFGLGFGFGGASRPFYQASLLINGEPQPLGPSEALPTWTGAIAPLMEKKMRVFELWMPHLVATDLLYIELDDSARVESAPPCALRWMAYGDSITQGMTVRLPHETHVARIARALNADMRNLGIGATAMEAYLAKTVPDFRYDICTIAYGVNDFSRSIPLAEFSENARSLARALVAKNPGKPVLFITPIPLISDKTHTTYGATLDDFRAALDAVAADFPETRSIGGPGLVPARAEMFVDGLHPNEAGAAHYAEGLLGAMRAALA